MTRMDSEQLNETLAFGKFVQKRSGTRVDCGRATGLRGPDMAANGRVSGTGPPVIDKDYLAAVEGAKKEVEALLEQTKCVPLFLRLAFHDAMTYDSNTKTGGANGSIRVQRELDHAGNENLSTAIELLQPVKTKYAILTYADLFQLSGILAIRVAGGPFIQFTPGNEQTVAQLKKGFVRLGMTTQQLVVLCGAHYVGRWGHESSTDPDLLDKHSRDLTKRFSNAYFKDLLQGKLSQDQALLQDPEIKGLVEMYAADQGKFLKDYAQTHEALSKLGTALPTVLFGGPAGAVCSSFGSLESYSTSEMLLGAAIIAGGTILAAGWWWNRRKRLLRGKV